MSKTYRARQNITRVAHRGHPKCPTRTRFKALWQLIYQILVSFQLKFRKGPRSRTQIPPRFANSIRGFHEHRHRRGGGDARRERNASARHAKWHAYLITPPLAAFRRNGVRDSCRRYLNRYRYRSCARARSRTAGRVPRMKTHTFRPAAAFAFSRHLRSTAAAFVERAGPAGVFRARPAEAVHTCEIHARSRKVTAGDSDG